MKQTTRIYTIANVSDDNGIRLIRASSAAKALAYATRTTISVRTATQTDLEIMIQRGVKVEELDQPVLDDNHPLPFPPV